MQAIKQSTDAPQSSARQRRRVAAAAVRAVIVYRGTLCPPAQRELLHACQRELMLSSSARRSTQQLKTVGASIRDVRKQMRNTQAQLDKRGKGDAKFRMRTQRKLDRYQKRLRGLEDSQEEILSGRSEAAQGGVGRGATGKAVGHDWGAAGALLPAVGGNKKTKAAAAGVKLEGQEVDKVVEEMEAVAEELSQVPEVPAVCCAVLCAVLWVPCSAGASGSMHEGVRVGYTPDAL